MKLKINSENLTNKFEEVNFKLDKLSTRVTKIQSDTQLRFSDLRKWKLNQNKKKKVNLPGNKQTSRFWCKSRLSNFKLTISTIN